MNVLTLEIRGAPVACICASDRSRAESLARQAQFRRDLRSHRSGGAALWDGQAKLSLRDSTSQEARIVEERIAAHDLSSGRIANAGAVVFLVAIDAERDDPADPAEDFLI